MSSVDNVTTGTCSFATVILKVALLALAAVVRTHFSIHFNENSTLQLISGNSIDLQKLLKYFSSTAIVTYFFVPLFSISPIPLALCLNDGALSLLVTFALLTNSSLLKPHKLQEVSK